MKRGSPLLRKTKLTAKTPLKRSSRLVSTSRLERTTLLRKTKLKAKRRRAKPGDEPLYKAWIKTQPCVVCGKRGRGVDGHHLINGKGDARKGMGQTAPDKFLIPMCRREHEDFHHSRGFCAGWTDEQRLSFQSFEVDRLRQIWGDLNDLSVLQEPARLCI